MTYSYDQAPMQLRRRDRSCLGCGMGSFGADAFIPVRGGMRTEVVPPPQPQTVYIPPTPPRQAASLLSSPLVLLAGGLALVLVVKKMRK